MSWAVFILDDGLMANYEKATIYKSAELVLLSAEESAKSRQGRGVDRCPQQEPGSHLELIHPGLTSTGASTHCPPEHSHGPCGTSLPPGSFLLALAQPHRHLFLKIK